MNESLFSIFFENSNSIQNEVLVLLIEKSSVIFSSSNLSAKL